jgi:hypothetical protein
MYGQNYKAKWDVHDKVGDVVRRQVDRCEYSLWRPAEHGLHDAVNISTEQAPELIFTLLPGVDPGLLDKFVGRVDR